MLFFDGKTTQGWKNFNEDTLTGWLVEEGCLVGQGLGGDIGGDIVSLADYENFIMQWEWKLGPHGNSGKWDEYPDYCLARKGKLCLQDHGSKVWFRNIKIRELE